MNESTEIEYAGFWVRFIAVLLDLILIGILTILFVSIFFGFDWLITDEILTKANTLNFLLVAVVSILLWVNWKGRTPGKRMMGIRIVSYPDYQGFGYKKAIIRKIVGYTLSLMIIGLGYIMIGIRRDKRGLHDLIAGTCVIYDKSTSLKHNAVNCTHEG